MFAQLNIASRQRIESTNRGGVLVWNSDTTHQKNAARFRGRRLWLWITRSHPPPPRGLPAREPRSAPGT